MQNIRLINSKNLFLTFLVLFCENIWILSQLYDILIKGDEIMNFYKRSHRLFVVSDKDDEDTITTSSRV